MSPDFSDICADIGERLRRVEGRLVTIESCTGGGIAWFLTSVAGSSEWFDRALVTYSNQSKSDLAGVTPATIATYGAVSEQTAHAMAIGGLSAASASHALSVTGIAGPSGGSEEKPVGMVCFAWAHRASGPNSDGHGISAESETRIFAGDRHDIRIATIHHGLVRLRDLLA